MSLQSEYCTLCGIVKSQVKFLYSDDSFQFGTVSKINQLFNQILSTSNYSSQSKFICGDCELSVHHFYKFWEMVQNVQKKLSFVQNKSPKNTSIFGGQMTLDQETGLSLCHTTGITSDSEPVLIKISVIKHIQCDVCKASLCTSQLVALHEVTHGLGTVLCQCEQCGHRDDISTFLQGKHNVLCPQCSLRKFHMNTGSTVDVETQFISPDEETSTLKNPYSLSANSSDVLSKIHGMGKSRQDIETPLKTYPGEKYGENAEYEVSDRVNPLTGSVSVDIGGDSPRFPQTKYKNVVSKLHNEYSLSCNESEDLELQPRMYSHSSLLTDTITPDECNPINPGDCNPIAPGDCDPINNRNELEFEGNFTNTNRVNTLIEFSSAKRNFSETNSTVISNKIHDDFPTSTNESSDVFPMSKNDSKNIYSSDKIQFATSSIQNEFTPDRSFSVPISNTSSSDLETATRTKSSNSIKQPDSISSVNVDNVSKGKSISHTCDVCSRGFNHKGHLKRHMLVHDKSIQQFLCEECGRRFNQKSSLHTHWKHLHCKDASAGNSFQCEWCGQVYSHKMNLQSHLLSVHSHLNTPRLKTQFYCDTCDKFFVSVTRLNAHLRVHRNKNSAGP